MAEAFKFRDRLLEMTQGKQHVMARAEKLLGTTHAITQAGDASKIPRADVQRHVIETVVQAAHEIVAEPLSVLIDAHSAVVEDEFALLEGDCPEDAGGRGEWLEDLANFARPTFAGEVEAMVGAEALEGWLRSEDGGEELARLLVSAPVKDYANELKTLGVTTSDLERLVSQILENRMPPQKGAAPAIAEPDGSTPASPKASTPRKRAATVDQPNEVTEATRNALAALADLTSLKEGDIAAALGVSRPQANNYRHARTLLAPTDEQVVAIQGLYDDILGKLRAAREAFDLAILGG